MVRFHDNAHVMRRFKGNRRKSIHPEGIDQTALPAETAIKNSISYSEMMGSEMDV